MYVHALVKKGKIFANEEHYPVFRPKVNMKNSSGRKVPDIVGLLNIKINEELNFSVLFP